MVCIEDEIVEPRVADVVLEVGADETAPRQVDLAHSPQSFRGRNVPAPAKAIGSSLLRGDDTHVQAALMAVQDEVGTSPNQYRLPFGCQPGESPEETVVVLLGTE